MSSVYSSEASSRRASESSSPSSSTSLNRDTKSTSDDEELDLDALFRKLDGYKSDMQEVEARLERQRSDTSKKDVDAAVAERFRLELQRLDKQKATEDESFLYALPVRSDSLSKGTKPLRLGQWNSESPILEYESASSNPSTGPSPELDFGFPEPDEVSNNSGKGFKKIRPSPLLLTASNTQPLEIHSACLPPRISSKRSPTSATSQEFSLKSHRRRVTVSEGRASSRNAIYISSLTELQSEHSIPPLPALNPSTAGPDAIHQQIPGSPMTMCFPDEDQLRRELEYFAVHDGAEPLDTLKYRRQRPPTLNLESDDSDEDINADWQSVGIESPMSEAKPSPVIAASPVFEKRLHKPQKSLFSVFRKKSEVDDLLDLYLDDDQLMKTTPLSAQESGPTKKLPLITRNIFSRGKSSSKISNPQLPSPPLRPPGIGQPI